MLDIKFIRENKDIVIAGAQKKRVKIDIEKLLELDNQRRELQVSVDDKRAQQNIASTAIAGAENSEKRIIIERMQNLKETLKLEEESLQGNFEGMARANGSSPECSGHFCSRWRIGCGQQRSAHKWRSP